MSVTMHATLDSLPNDPLWQRQARPRLAASLAVSAVLVAIVLAVLRFPVPNVIAPGPEILLRLLPQILEPLANSPNETEEQVVTESPPAKAESAAARDVVDPADDVPGVTGAGDTAEIPPDWYGQLDAAAKTAVDELERIESVNPLMDQKRAAAAKKFYASMAPVKKEIWDNVETDQLGRKILWAGDCYRVIDEPSAANYEIWREFQQYFIYCKFGSPDPKMLPWVGPIRERYLYLKYPDGEIPLEELRKYIER